jgi:ABC-type lipoprotein export system ATPase subunit
MSNFLELKKIFKTFKTEKTVKVLKNLSQKFDKGKSYSITGPSGSGKSTLLNLISLIDRPLLGLLNSVIIKLILTTKIRMIFLEQKILVLFINKIIYFLILQL